LASLCAAHLLLISDKTFSSTKTTIASGHVPSSPSAALAGSAAVFRPSASIRPWKNYDGNRGKTRNGPKTKIAPPSQTFVQKELLARLNREFQPTKQQQHLNGNGGQKYFKQTTTTTKQQQPLIVGMLLTEQQHPATAGVCDLFSISIVSGRDQQMSHGEVC
jgi:hypothetical protein